MSKSKRQKVEEAEKNKAGKAEYKLTERQKRFITEYLVDFNATQAAKRAGYSEDTANQQATQLLANPYIKDELDKIRAKREHVAGLTREDILNKLRQVADRCMQAEQVLDKRGEPTGEYRFDSSGAIKALELLGKHLGMFSLKVEHSGSIAHEVALRELK